MNIKQAVIALIAIAIVVTLLSFMGKRSDETDQVVSVLDEYTETATYQSDTTLAAATTIAAGEATYVEGDSVLTAEADLVIDGALGCRDGSLTLITRGTLTINDVVACDGATGSDITIVAEGGLIMAPEARIIANGNVQLVDSQAGIKDEQALDQLYDAVATEPTTGQYVGPLLEDTEPTDNETNESDTENTAWSLRDWLMVRTAHAQVDNGTTTVNLTAQPIRVSGKIKVGTPRPGAKRIVVFDFPNTPEVTVQDFELEGPDGRAGETDTGSCDVTGKDGEDAFRFNAFAPNLIVNNFTLVLGDGGAGGDATTGDDCDEARAKGGNGGKSGNFRMIGSEKFAITGAFMIHPGDGGAGGTATANGKVGKPSEKGGDARATGGRGASNNKKLSVSGTVAGTSNVQFGDAVGGIGGGAFAEGGAGGDADTCGMVGGTGGNAAARSGDGGDAKLTITGGATRMAAASDIGGEGGSVSAVGGNGGAGGSCDETKRGGDGGVGGNAVATEGKGGFGANGRANDGAEWADAGGDGGNGGDGCTEGLGGKGGGGNTDDGERGEDGRNICPTITKEEDYISLAPGEIEVLMYMDYEIPLNNIEVVAAHEPNCDGDHYHPAAQGAINTMGYNTPDPAPNGCGFGKVGEVEIRIIQDPNYVAPEAEAEGGQMIQIEPPKLIIPAGQSGW